MGHFVGWYIVKEQETESRNKQPKMSQLKELRSGACYCPCLGLVLYNLFISDQKLGVTSEVGKFADYNQLTQGGKNEIRL